MGKAKVPASYKPKYYQIVQPIKSNPFNPKYRNHIQSLIQKRRFPPRTSVGLGSKDIYKSIGNDSGVRGSIDFGSDATE